MAEEEYSIEEAYRNHLWFPGHCGHPHGDRVDLLAKAFSVLHTVDRIPDKIVTISNKSHENVTRTF